MAEQEMGQGHEAATATDAAGTAREEADREFELAKQIELEECARLHTELVATKMSFQHMHETRWDSWQVEWSKQVPADISWMERLRCLRHMQMVLQECCTAAGVDEDVATTEIKPDSGLEQVFWNPFPKDKSISMIVSQRGQPSIRCI